MANAQDAQYDFVVVGSSGYVPTNSRDQVSVDDDYDDCGSPLCREEDAVSTAGNHAHGIEPPSGDTIRGVAYYDVVHPQLLIVAKWLVFLANGTITGDQFVKMLRFIKKRNQQ